MVSFSIISVCLSFGALPYPFRPKEKTRADPTVARPPRTVRGFPIRPSPLSRGLPTLSRSGPFSPQRHEMSQDKRVSHVHHRDQTDDLSRAIEILERIAHAPWLTQSGTAREFSLTLPVAELCGKVGDGVNQAADLISATASIPS
jgi:hypothetical protein